jgi:hypothetical protein
MREPAPPDQLRKQTRGCPKEKGQEEETTNGWRCYYDEWHGNANLILIVISSSHQDRRDDHLMFQRL